MSSLPHNVNFGPRGGGGGTGGGDDNSSSQFGCPAHQSKECEVRVPERFDSSNTFEVRLQRNSLGLGFSIGGGLGREEGPWAGFVRIKKIFPLQPAWLDGRLMCGDIVVSVGGAELTGLPLVRALDLLRSGPTCTVLSVHRPCARHQVEDSENKKFRRGNNRNSLDRNWITPDFVRLWPGAEASPPPPTRGSASTSPPRSPSHWTSGIMATTSKTPKILFLLVHIAEQSTASSPSSSAR